MVYQRQSRFAPPYVHDPEPDATASNGYGRPLGAALGNICAGLLRNLIPIGGGDQGSVYSDTELRLDRQREFNGGNGHPMDNYANYQLQANLQARNRTLAQLAARGNGQHAAQGGLGGSSVASVNFQTSRVPSSIGRDLSPERVNYSLNHSNRCQDTLWVLDRQTNAETVPSSRRQQSAVYHENPYQGYTGRANPSNPFYGARDDGRLTTHDSIYYTGESEDTFCMKTCDLCGTRSFFLRRTCSNPNCRAAI
jgi:hypothetical protein